MAERSSAIFWVLNCPIYLLRCYSSSAGSLTSSELMSRSPDLKSAINFSSFSLEILTVRLMGSELGEKRTISKRSSKING
ncbi:MAG: hypothetical protein LW723_10410 [Pseudanabaena sp. 42896M_M3]|nr:hypothetical protein [Pseudanabaena sp. 42896M_M3]